MPKDAATLKAMQFSILWDKNPMNKTGAPREKITYQYAGTKAPSDLPGSSYSGWTAFKSAEKKAFEKALRHIETFLNVKFVEVSGQSDPDMNVGKVNLNQAGYGGFGLSYSGKDILTYDSFVLFNKGHTVGSDVSLILHELGHALGLKHLHDAPTVKPYEDSNKYSVMSYKVNPDNKKKSDGMQLLDIFALQDLWGAAGFNGDNTKYTKARNSTVDAIWDTGGVDTFSAAGRKASVTFDLREGAFSSFHRKNDVVISYGTKIENATGGSGADKLIGNGFKNVLSGNAGNDTLFGKGGNDNLRGGTGNDKLIGDAGKDKLRGGGGEDKLVGGGGDDTLNGDAQDDVVLGGTGHDVLIGGFGNDTLRGGSGNDRLLGNAGNDKLLGEAGRDTLIGGDGDDLLIGGDEADALKGDAGADELRGDAGNDELYGGDDDDTLFGGNGDDALAGEAGNDTLNGNDGADKLDGGTGMDSLVGGTGDDTLTGGADADLFVFNAGDGHDRITDFEDDIDTLQVIGHGPASKVLATGIEQDGDVILQLSATETITIEGITLAQLEDDLIV